MPKVPMRTTRAMQASLPSAGGGATIGTQVREQNSAMLLRLLWQAREISRADLARKTGLSRSTISAIAATLLETGLVHEARTGESRGGRKPILLAFDDDAFHLVGVDLGATHVSVVVTNLRGKQLAWTSRAHPVRTDPSGALNLVQALVEQALEEVGAPLEDVLGVGVAVPSPVNPQLPGRLLPLILPKWEGVDLVHELTRRFEVPVFVDNDANLGALAEVWWGGYAGTSDLAFIKVGLGVGSGLVIDGRVHRGRKGTAGEIGHTSLDPTGPRCVCGLNGCINTLIGSKNLLVRAKDQVEAFPQSTLAKRRRINIDHLVDAALEGDPLAADVIGFAGRTLGVGVANLLNLLAPEVVVLGGSLTRAQQALIEPLQDTLAGMSLADSVNRVRIEISKLGVSGIALGAATLALEAALHDPRLFEHRQGPGRIGGGGT